METGAPMLGEPLPVELMNTIWADRDGVHDALSETTGAMAWLQAVAPRLGVVTGPEPGARDDRDTVRIAQEFTMMASLIENTGPNLTPANMAGRAPALGAVGGGTTGHSLLQFAPNDFQWTQDARVVFWSKTTPSSYNNTPGTFLPIEGSRFNLGQYPTIPSGEPPIPNPRP